MGASGDRKRPEKRQGRTDFGLGGANVTPLHVARERALKYRMMAKQGINPKYSAVGAIPTFEEVARQVHMERLQTWRNKKHGDQFINTLRDYAFPKIGRCRFAKPFCHVCQGVNVYLPYGVAHGQGAGGALGRI